MNIFELFEKPKDIKSADMGDVVKDFYKSDAPQFIGKSKKKRRQMAIAAKLSANESTGDLHDRLYDLEAALRSAREITKQIKYADTHMTVIGELEALAEKVGLKLDDYDVRQVYQANNSLESAVYELEAAFEEAIRDIQNEIDDAEYEESVDHTHEGRGSKALMPGGKLIVGKGEVAFHDDYGWMARGWMDDDFEYFDSEKEARDFVEKTYKFRKEISKKVDNDDRESEWERRSRHLRNEPKVTSYNDAYKFDDDEVEESAPEGPYPSQMSDAELADYIGASEEEVRADREHAEEVANDISRDHMHEGAMKDCPCCNGGKGACSHGKEKCGTCNGTGKVPADFETEEFPLDESTYECDDKFFEAFGWIEDNLEEAEYRGRKVKLNKPMQGDVKKFKVYVKDPKTGNVKKVNFGHGGSSVKGKAMKIRKNNPKARKSFRARHNCDNPGPKTKARYWSCRKW